MTIAIITMIRDAWGGSEELWYEMAKEALSKGHRVIHLAFETPKKHRKIIELESAGMIHYTRPGWVPDTSATGKLFYLGWNFVRKKIKDPFRQIFRHEPDVLLYNGTCYSIASEKSLLNQLSLERKKNLRFFIIGHLNNQFARKLSDRQAAIVSQAYKLCTKVFFISQRSIATAQRHLFSAIENAAIIRNPVNMSSTAIIPFPTAAGTLQMATVGILVTEHKGQDILIQALAEWPHKDWLLNIYGAGPDLYYLKQVVAYFKLENKIIFHGSVENIRQVWEKNQLLLMPSIMEGMPLAVVEAMLCGRICIATDVGGHAEWIRDGENGFIAKAPTKDALIEKLNEAWSKRERWEEMGRRAHLQACQFYDANPGASLLQHFISE
jgi:glycosyltransferase involved in cell wall biosynthesis